MLNRICKMCLKDKPLIQSHLMPRALYDLCRTEDSEPVKVTSQVIMQTSRQTKDYLLCAECDNLLSKEGETWLLPKLATYNDGFPLYDILQKVPPDITDDDGSMGYAISRNPEINVNAITHFVMGIFWKASAHSWLKDKKEPRIELGPYGERVRKFLRGEADFPDNMVLNLGVVPPSIKFINFLDPYEGSGSPRNFVFNIPGMQFGLTVGKTIFPDVKQTCFYRNPLHPIVVADFARDMKKIYQAQSKKAHKSRKLIEYLSRGNLLNTSPENSRDIAQRTYPLRLF